MTVDEFFGGFDEDEHAYSIQKLDQSQLRREHDQVRKKVVAAKSTIGASGLSIFHTAGFSAIGAGVGWRKHNYNAKKQNICEARMRREGGGVEEMRKRDFLLAVGPSAAASVLVPGAESAASHLISHAAGHGAAAWTSHHAADTILQATHHSGQFVHGVSDGVSSQVHAVGQGLMGNATNLVPIDAVAQNTPQSLGYIAGQGLANSAEMAAVKKVTEKGVKAVITPMIARETVSSAPKLPWLSSENKPRLTQHRGKERNTRSADDNLAPKLIQKPPASNHVQRRSVPIQPANIKRNTRSADNDLAPKLIRNPPASNHVQRPTIPIKLTDIKPFIIYLLPPVINNILGLRALQLITFVVLVSDLYNSNQTKLLSMLIYHSLPAIIASIFEKNALWFATFVFELLIAYSTPDTHITTPGVFACIAAPLIVCTDDEVKALTSGFCWFSILMDIIQSRFTRNSFDVTSSEYVPWYSWRRAEYAALASVISLIRGSQIQLEPKYMLLLIGAGSAGLLISILQLKTRRR